MFHKQNHEKPDGEGICKPQEGQDTSSPSQENPLGTSPIGKTLLKFAIPSCITMLIGSLYNIVDQFFIGKTVGLLGNSATNVAFPFTLCCAAIALLFGCGGAAAFNLSMGRQEETKAPWYIGNATTAMVLFGVGLCVVTQIFLGPLLQAFGAPQEVLPYAKTYVRICALGFPFLILTSGGGHLIRADRRPRLTMITALSGALVNVVLDYLFVMRWGWGMMGAALATILGQILSGSLVLWLLVARFQTVPLRPEHFKWRTSLVGKMGAMGSGLCVNQLANLVMQVVLNNSLRYYGALSVYGAATALAVAGIASKVNQVSWSIIVGICQGSQPLLSFNYGARQYQRVKKTFWLALRADAVIAGITFLCYQLFPTQILGLFGSGSEAYFACGTKFFRIYMFMTFINFLQASGSVLFTALGKPVKGVFLSLTRQVFFFVPLMLLIPHFWGFTGVLYAAPVADALAMIAVAVVLLLEFRDMATLEKHPDPCGQPEKENQATA